MALTKKLAGCRDRKPHVLALTAMLVAAARYCRAAAVDEHRGYPCAAAIEWRKAAETLTRFPELADQCWNKWEQLMHLPRRLAAPIGESADMLAASAGL